MNLNQEILKEELVALDQQDFNMQLSDLLKEWTLEGLNNAHKLEADYFELNEIKIDSLDRYEYYEVMIPIYTKAYQFEDRCQNKIVAVYIDSVKEFKTGYKIDGHDNLIFQPEKLDKVEDYIRPCPDDKKVSTVYKILTTEIIPNYLLSSRPGRLMFNPVSKSRDRLVSIILNKVTKDMPELIKKNNYLIYR